MSDSGPNLGVRGVAFLCLVAGVYLIYTGYRVRRGTSRLHLSQTMAIYGIGVLIAVGVAALAFGAFLLGADF
jgi:hypothetical protein